ncbi:Variant SH3 domain containing protein [Tritrichomonas foetus]|uniref:Variant SH3 domain containing protein n=1 Tax=Tritrichomonas foetus TaxID=1144522 RepID=A0A1J4JGB4_9EUKA|nr:Variant SH3 domain containing protein [Tritrichomonas foetus]|eukprot:OHS97697.1 Variant SH3 domain containing protein [Tritrichomonas foetus]
MQFVYDEKSPSIIEGWMSKANIGVFERWQKRLFKIQGRCIFYFKKENGEPPRGKIPLIDIEVKDLPPKKNRNFGFSINITKNKSNAKRSEYLINAESKEQRDIWKRTIMENRAKSIVGETYCYGCNVSPTNPDAHLLLPYFIPPLFTVLDSSGYKSHGIWTTDIPEEIIMKYLHQFDQNLQIKHSSLTSDTMNVLGAVRYYLKLLPKPLLSPESMVQFRDKVTSEQIRQIVLSCDAPIKQFLKVLASHFKKMLEASSLNGVTVHSLTPILGPILIRAPSNASFPPAQTRSIQDQVASTFLNNSSKILEDVHQFLEAPRQPVIRCARITASQFNQGDDILDGPKGLLVSVVRQDNTGWCTVYTSNRRVGLVHDSNLRRLSQEEENELKSGPNIDGMLDVVRERMPEMSLLFDAMVDESMKLRELLE